MKTDQSSKSTDLTSEESTDKSTKVPAATAAAKPATVNVAGTNKNVTANPANGVTVKGTIAKEYGGPKGLEPTRYGDWEKNGRCSDF